MAVAEQRPIRLVVRDDLARSRLTVVFRLFLAIPLFVWVVLRGIAAAVVGFVNWLAVLIQGEVPDSLHGFVASYIRYSTQVSAYVFLAANPYPWFRCQSDYPVDLEIDPPVRQGRWGGFFRLVLALPAIVIASVLGSGLTSGSPSESSWSASSGHKEALWWNVSSFGGVAAAAAVVAWFFIVWLGRAPRGLRDLTAYALGYGAQAGAYLFLLTPRYPTSDPELAEPYSDLPEHPVRAVVDDDLMRPRLTVLFRFFLAIPHFVWIFLWSIAVVFVAFVGWIAALVLGRLPDPLHRFLAAYIRYATHLVAFVYLVGRRFPGFTGREGSYGIDLAIDPPAEQRRLTILFRFFLAVPAFIVASALGGVAFVLALLVWWYALVTARMPEGMRNLGVTCLRYSGADVCIRDARDRSLSVRRARPPPGGAGTRGARRLPDARPRRHLLRIAFVALGAVGARGRGVSPLPDRRSGLARARADRRRRGLRRQPRRAREAVRAFLLRRLGARTDRTPRHALDLREARALPSRGSRPPGRSARECSSECSVSRSRGSCTSRSHSQRTGGSGAGTRTTSATSTGSSRTGLCSPRSSCPSASRCSSSWASRESSATAGGFRERRVFVAIASLFSFVAPYLDFTTTPLKDKALLEAAAGTSRSSASATSRSESRRSAPTPIRRTPTRSGSGRLGASSSGTRSSGIRSRRTSRRWCSRTSSGTTRSEHLPKGIGWFALFAIPGAWILMRTTRRRGGMGAPEAVPLALLVVAVFQLATPPLASHISRRMEAEADWKALQVTRDPAALEGVMVGLAQDVARRPRPARPGAARLRDASALAERVAMARAWAETSRP